MPIHSLLTSLDKESIVFLNGDTVSNNQLYRRKCGLHFNNYFIGGVMFLIRIWMVMTGIFTAGNFLSAIKKFRDGEIASGIFFFMEGAILLPILSLSEVREFLTSWGMGFTITIVYLGLMFIFDNHNNQQ